MVKEHRYFVYIMASKRHGTLYVGVTSNLAGRVGEHRDKLREGFTKKYGVHLLVWFEEFSYTKTPFCAGNGSRSGAGLGK
ncbi:MAG TPA: GIY-YIG nuclease family protein [Rhizomicrobium sp.]|nr:GIY-YIG nuclease family protein [Rhizomicrobium sp.]